MPTTLNKHIKRTRNAKIGSLVRYFIRIAKKGNYKAIYDDGVTAFVGKDLTTGRLTLGYNPNFFARLTITSLIAQNYNFANVNDIDLHKAAMDIVDYVLLHEMEHLYDAHLTDIGNDLFVKVFNADPKTAIGRQTINIAMDSQINYFLDNNMPISPNPGIHGSIYGEFGLFVPTIEAIGKVEGNGLTDYLFRNNPDKKNADKVQNFMNRMKGKSFNSVELISSYRGIEREGMEVLDDKYSDPFKLGHMVCFFTNKNPYFPKFQPEYFLGLHFFPDHSKIEDYMADWQHAVGKLPFLKKVFIPPKEQKTLQQQPKPPKQPPMPPDAQQEIAAIKVATAIMDTIASFPGLSPKGDLKKMKDKVINDLVGMSKSNKLSDKSLTDYLGKLIDDNLRL